MDEDIEELIEASSLGTPEARALREQGRRILKGELAPIDVKLAAIAADFTRNRIDEREAYDRCIEAGCTPEAARIHVKDWAGGEEP